MLPVTYTQGQQALCAKPTDGGAFRHVWVDAAAMAAAGQPTLDGFQAVNATGENVYFSVASFCSAADAPPDTFTTYAGRKQANVRRLRALVMDLDYAKFGKDLAWALGLTDTLPVAFALPPCTMVVDTGGGIHGYWHLNDELPPVMWLDLAHRLAAVFRQVNGHVGRVIDTQCTVDLCRVLRVPGFRNHKYAHAPLVQIVRPAAGVIDVEAMRAALAHIDPGPIAAPVPLPTLAMAAGFAPAPAGAGLQSAFAEALTFQPADWAQIRDKSRLGVGCEVLRQVLLDNNAAGYEVWAGLLSIVQHTDGGDEALKAVSAGHRDYGVSTHLLDCRSKAASFHSPRTCAQFASQMPDACARCAHNGKIKSPIMLGRGHIRIEVAPTAAQVAEAHVAPPDTIIPPQIEGTVEGPAPSPDIGDTWPPIDKMFRYRPGTCEVEMRQKTDTPGAVAYGVICNRPLWLEYTVDDRVCLGVIDPERRTHLREFEAARLLAGTDWGPFVAWLTPRGVHPMFTTSLASPAHHPLIMLTKSLIHRYGAQKALAEVEHFGPSAEVRPTDFVLGNTCYFADGRAPETIRIPEGSLLAEHAAGMAADADGHAIAQEFSRRLEPVYAGPEWALDRFVLASALAASLSPFLVPREMQGGVVVVSSPGSGEAKSSTLMTAAALYTRNPNTLKRSNATPTAVFKVLLPRLNAVPLFLDDWDKQIRGSRAEDVASALTELLVQSTNLRPKALANGEVTPGWWSTWLYLATNSDVADLVSRTETGGAAAGMRFLEVPIPKRQHISAERQGAYESFRTWREQHSGQTMHAFLRTALPHITYLQQRYAFWTDRIRTEHPELGIMAVRFLRAMVACTMAAAEAAAQMHLLPFDVEELFATGCTLIARQVTTTEAHVVEQDNLLGAYLAANLSRVVHIGTATRALMTSATEMAAAVDKDDTVLIPTSALADWLRRTGRSQSHLATRLKRTHPDMQVATRAVPVAGLTLTLRCYIVTIEGISGQVEAAQMPVPPRGAAVQVH